MSRVAIDGSLLELVARRRVLQAAFAEARADADATPADRLLGEVRALLELGRTRALHDVLSPPLVRAFLRTGILAPSALPALIDGCRSHAAAALIVGECSHELDRDALPWVLETIERVDDPIVAARARSHLLVSCLESGEFALAERVIEANGPAGPIGLPDEIRDEFRFCLGVQRFASRAEDPSCPSRRMDTPVLAEHFRQWCSSGVVRRPLQKGGFLEAREARRTEIADPLHHALHALRATGRFAPRRLQLLAAFWRARARATRQALATDDGELLLEIATAWDARTRQRGRLVSAGLNTSALLRGLDASFDREIGFFRGLEASSPIAGPHRHWLWRRGVRLWDGDTQALLELAPAHAEIGHVLLGWVERELGIQVSMRGSACGVIGPFLNDATHFQRVARLEHRSFSGPDWFAHYLGTQGDCIAAEVAGLARNADRSTVVDLAQRLKFVAEQDARRAMQDTLRRVGAGVVERLGEGARAGELGDLPAAGLLRLGAERVLAELGDAAGRRLEELMFAVARSEELEDWTEGEVRALLQLCGRCPGATELLVLRCMKQPTAAAVHRLLAAMSVERPPHPLRSVLARAVRRLSESDQDALSGLAGEMGTALREPVLLELAECALEAGRPNALALERATSFALASSSSRHTLPPRFAGYLCGRVDALLDVDLSTRPYVVRDLTRTAPREALEALCSELLQRSAATGEFDSLIMLAAGLPGFSDPDAAGRLLLRAAEDARTQSEPLSAHFWSADFWSAVEFALLGRVVEQMSDAARYERRPAGTLALAAVSAWVTRAYGVVESDAVFATLERCVRSGASMGRTWMPAVLRLAPLVREPDFERFVELFANTRSAFGGGRVVSHSISDLAPFLTRALDAGVPVERLVAWSDSIHDDGGIALAKVVLPALQGKALEEVWTTMLERDRARRAGREDGPCGPSRGLVNELGSVLPTLRPDAVGYLWDSLTACLVEADAAGIHGLLRIFLPRVADIHGSDLAASLFRLQDASVSASRILVSKR